MITVYSLGHDFWQPLELPFVVLPCATISLLHAEHTRKTRTLKSHTRARACTCQIIRDNPIVCVQINIYSCIYMHTYEVDTRSGQHHICRILPEGDWQTWVVSAEILESQLGCHRANLVWDVFEKVLPECASNWSLTWSPSPAPEYRRTHNRRKQRDGIKLCACPIWNIQGKLPI